MTGLTAATQPFTGSLDAIELQVEAAKAIANRCAALDRSVVTDA
jgi:hypothetical protein